MTNYEAIKVLKFMQRQVSADSEEDLALQHAILLTAQIVVIKWTLTKNTDISTIVHIAVLICEVKKNEQRFNKPFRT